MTKRTFIDSASYYREQYDLNTTSPDKRVIFFVLEVDAETTGTGPHAGFGRPGRPQFWITEGEPITGRLHVAFIARDQAAVDDFYKAAIASGASDNGPPGLRPHYHPDYYGAFVFDLDGHNIEAVCHAPPR
jgi:catechol 2,3-dioxygenase-like lactoylglutathione lyase family enzyme